MSAYTPEAAEVLEPSEKILEKSYELHNGIDTGQESFHNAKHIEAVAKASNMIVSQAELGIDPFDLQGDLDKWNEANPNAQVSDLKQFKKIARIAFAAHDWGNIMSDLDINSQGNVTPTYHEAGYIASGAEDRSKEMLEKYINSLEDFPEEEKEATIKLGQHLIENTKFDFMMNGAEDVPFKIFTAAMDQVGNDIYSENDDRIIGLLNEQIEEAKQNGIDLNDASIPGNFVSPQFYNNFGNLRLETIVKDPEKRKQILQIWGKPNGIDSHYFNDTSWDNIKISKLEFRDRMRAIKIIEQNGGGLTEAVKSKLEDEGLGYLIHKDPRTYSEMPPVNPPSKPENIVDTSSLNTTNQDSA